MSKYYRIEAVNENCEVVYHGIAHNREAARELYASVKASIKDDAIVTAAVCEDVELFTDEEQEAMEEGLTYWRGGFEDWR